MGMCCKKDNDWLKKCMEYEVEVPGQKEDQKTLEIVEKDYQTCKSNWEDAMDHNRWRQQIRDD